LSVTDGGVNGIVPRHTRNTEWSRHARCGRVTPGGLLVALPEEQGMALEAEFARAGVFLARVGSVEAGAGVALV